MNITYLQNQIIKLKKKKNALILAHYYQRNEIQQIADFVGDSLELSKKALEFKSELLIFCGVHFMAETAKILNPYSKVVLPDLDAGCSLADSTELNEFIKWRRKFPEHVLVSYINSRAEIKAISDYICTSSNAIKTINSIPKNQKIIFAPDLNLGKYLIKETGRELELWNGRCVVHEAFSIQKLINLVIQFPTAKVVAHPESNPKLLKLAHFIGSTSAIIQYIKESESVDIFLIGTEAGILHQIERTFPNKKLIPIPIDEENSCACSECSYMKVNTLEKVLACLKNESPEILLDPLILDLAQIPIQRMIQLSYGKN